MGEAAADSRYPGSDDPTRVPTCPVRSRIFPRIDAARAQTAILIGLLLAIQFVAAVLTPLGKASSDDFWDYFVLGALGAWAALPTLAAVWGVFGPQRAAVRLPLSLWILAAIYLATLYGEMRNNRQGNQSPLLLGGAWLLGCALVELPLWGLRAFRGWRLERTEHREETAASAVPEGGQAMAKSTSQFSLRALLAWTLAFALLLGGLRGVVPDIALEWRNVGESLLDTMMGSVVFALPGLPVIALAWIVLADGRRIVLRATLISLILAGVAGAWTLLGRLVDFDAANQLLCLKAGVILDALFNFSVVRACGFRLRRHRRKLREIVPPEAWAPATLSRFRFSVALVPLLAVAAVLASLVPGRLEEWRQTDVQTEWRRSGIGVTFDEAGKIYGANCIGMAALSDETCRQIASINELETLNLVDSSINDGQLALLAPLTRLKQLALPGSPLTDVGLQRLEQFPELISLDLTDTQITDAGLNSLKALPHLHTLRLCLTDISDAAISTLEQLPALQSVDVSLTAIGAEAAEKFRRLQPPRHASYGASDFKLSVCLSRMGIRTGSTAGFRNVGVGSDVVTLKRLHAGGKVVTNAGVETVTDAGLLLLADQTDLEELDLRESGVTDKGLPTLRTLKQLKRLDLRGAAVTEQGVAELGQALPKCEILHGARPHKRLP